MSCTPARLGSARESSAIGPLAGCRTRDRDVGCRCRCRKCRWHGRAWSPQGPELPQGRPGRPAAPGMHPSPGLPPHELTIPHGRSYLSSAPSYRAAGGGGRGRGRPARPTDRLPRAAAPTLPLGIGAPSKFARHFRGLRGRDVTARATAAACDDPEVAGRGRSPGGGRLGGLQVVLGVGWFPAGSARLWGTLECWDRLSPSLRRSAPSERTFSHWGIF